AVVADEVVRLLLGPAWDAVVLPLQILAGAAVFRTNYKLAAIVARAVGDVGRVAVTQVVYAVAVVGGATLASRWGAAGVAASTSLAIVLTCATLTHVALRRTAIGWRAVLGAHGAGLA